MTRESLSWLGSLTLHAGLLACLGTVIAPTTMQIDFVRGRASIELQASVAAVPRPEPEDAPIPKIEQPRPVQKEEQLELEPRETPVERRAPEVPELPEAKPTDIKPIEIALVIPATTKQETSEEVAEAEIEPPKRKKSETKVEVMEMPTESRNSIASMAIEGAEYDELPQPHTRNRGPEYPSDAKASGHQGRVELWLWITSEGTVETVKVVRSSGFKSLDNAAVESAYTWKFKPARRDGSQAAAVYQVGLNFRLEG